MQNGWLDEDVLLLAAVQVGEHDLGPRVGEHPIHMAVEVLQDLALGRGREQRLVGHRVPDQIGQLARDLPVRQHELAVAGGAELGAVQEVRGLQERRDHPADRVVIAVLGLARRVDRVVPVDLLIKQRTPEGPLAEVDDEAPGTVVRARGVGIAVHETAQVTGYGLGGDVANGGFEEVAPFGGFGWRYKDSAGVQRLRAPGMAFEGEHFVRLSSQDAIHQPNPASNGDTVSVSWWARAEGGSGTLEATVDFRNQQIYLAPMDSTTRSFALSGAWQLFQMSVTAPASTPNPVFHTRLTFTPAAGSTVDVDAVSMTVN